MQKIFSCFKKRHLSIQSKPRKLGFKKMNCESFTWFLTLELPTFCMYLFSKIHSLPLSTCHSGIWVTSFQKYSLWIDSYGWRYEKDVDFFRACPSFFYIESVHINKSRPICNLTFFIHQGISTPHFEFLSSFFAIVASR